MPGSEAFFAFAWKASLVILAILMILNLILAAVRRRQEDQTLKQAEREYEDIDW